MTFWKKSRLRLKSVKPAVRYGWRFETDCDDEALAFLEEMLPIEESRVIRVTGPLDLTLFSKFASIPGCSNMCYDPIIPVAGTG